MHGGDAGANRLQRGLVLGAALTYIVCAEEELLPLFGKIGKRKTSTHHPPQPPSIHDPLNLHTSIKSHFIDDEHKNDYIQDTMIFKVMECAVKYI